MSLIGTKIQQNSFSASLALAGSSASAYNKVEAETIALKPATCPTIVLQAVRGYSGGSACLIEHLRKTLRAQFTSGITRLNSCKTFTKRSSRVSNLAIVVTTSFLREIRVRAEVLITPSLFRMRGKPLEARGFCLSSPLYSRPLKTYLKVEPGVSVDNYKEHK